MRNIPQKAIRLAVVILLLVALSMLTPANSVGRSSSLTRAGSPSASFALARSQTSLLATGKLGSSLGSYAEPPIVHEQFGDKQDHASSTQVYGLMAAGVAVILLAARIIYVRRKRL